MKLVLLPGMDGTGLLYKPLIDSLKDRFDVEVISYSTTQEQSYTDLVTEVKSKLPSEPFVLLAESFSGNIAFQISLDKSIPIEKLILFASFLSSPYPKLGKILSWLPLTIFFRMPIPAWALRIFCFGPWINDQLIKIFKKSLSSVSPKVIAYRLRLLLDLKRSNEK